jgi:hypothetical protein
MSAAPLDAFARSVSPAGGALAQAVRARTEDAAEGTSPWAQALEGAARLAQKVAFPMILAAIVAGFLVVHNRVDRHDPKLALAPVDQDQEVLYFE